MVMWFAGYTPGILSMICSTAVYYVSIIRLEGFLLFYASRMEDCLQKRKCQHSDWNEAPRVPTTPRGWSALWEGQWQVTSHLSCCTVTFELTERYDFLSRVLSSTRGLPGISQYSTRDRFSFVRHWTIWMKNWCSGMSIMRNYVWLLSCQKMCWHNQVNKKLNFRN